MNVSQEIVSKAYWNFTNLFYEGHDGKGMHLWAFLGMSRGPKNIMFGPGGWTFPDKEGHILTMLAGPHYQAVAKMLLLRGHQHEVPVPFMYEPFEDLHNA